MIQPSPIECQSIPPQLAQVDFNRDLVQEKSTYLKQLKKWQKALLAVQQAYFLQKRRVIIVFEGWDAAGKGGAIRRITEKLDPRGFQVHPIAAPRADEQGRHYLYRFQTKLPVPGTMAIFDRSYYGRVLVERVEGFASEAQWQRAYTEINEFERLLMDDGVKVLKFFLHISPEEQLKRFASRLSDPFKQWKLTPEDIRNRLKWNDYAGAIDDMLRYTSTKAAPWHVLSANHKWTMRLEVLEILVNELKQGVDITPPPLDPELIKSARLDLGIELE